VIIWLGIFIGVGSRTILPYLKKADEAAKNNTNLAFELRFVFTAILSAMISAVLVYDIFVIPTGASTFKIFIAAVLFGLGTDSALNAIAH
jgi:hypothetical protein